MIDSLLRVRGAVYQGIQRLYNSLLRERLPRTWQVTDEITVRTGRLLDQTLITDMERALREGAQDAIQPGDTVVIVGGGAGTSTVAASRAAGHNGEVIVFEAVSEQIERIKETLDHNHTSAPVKLVHAAVGVVSDESVDMFGAPDGGAVSADQLPDGDVVVLDCEGAEDEIVPVLDSDEIVVETHEWATLEPESVAGYDSEFVGNEDDFAAVWALSARRGDDT